MSKRLIILGVVALVFGIAAAVDGGIASAVPVSTSVATGIGLTTAAIGAYVLWTRRPETLPTDEEAPETPVKRTHIGGEFERDLESLRSPGRGAIRQQRQLRLQLEQTAHGVLTTHDGLTEEQAAQALDRGSWTDNPHAAAYFCGRYPEWAPLSLRVRDGTPLGPDETTKLTAALTELESIAEEPTR